VADALPARRVAVCRELTKLHEETVRGLAADVAAEFARREASGGVKGEIVLVIDAPGDGEQQQRAEDAAEAAGRRARELAEQGALSKKDIVKALVAEFGISRNEAYDLVHAR
jgi:16S rRNA (cytidine1402-2'-O)-methyltransferase